MVAIRAGGGNGGGGGWGGGGIDWTMLEQELQQLLQWMQQMFSGGSNFWGGLNPTDPNSNPTVAYNNSSQGGGSPFGFGTGDSSNLSGFNFPPVNLDLGSLFAQNNLTSPTGTTTT